MTHKLAEVLDPKPLTPHRVIAERVRQLRRGRGWSAAKLAERMTAEGIPWDRSIVANLENGRRATVSVEEFLTLAYVLDVAPVHLVVPPADNKRPQTGGYVEVAPVPTSITTPGIMRAWIRGLMTFGKVDPRRYFTEVPDSEYQPPQSAAEQIRAADLREGRDDASR